MSDNYDNIPDDMRKYPQWIVWKLEDRQDAKPTKVPYSATSGRKASVTDPSTWTTYEHAVSCARTQNMTYAGLGFVFTANDPFAGVDLDDVSGDPKRQAVQVKIFDMFDSYSEMSPSGTGLHIICRGHVPNGRRRGGVELYSSERFFTMTGDVYRHAGINERQVLTSTLWHELGGVPENLAYGGDTEEKASDQDVINRAANATNGEKFTALHWGDFSAYPSQSEADQAYMNFLAFYTQHRGQLMRLFRASPLGKRDKAQRDKYLTYTINRAFDLLVPPVDLDAFKNAVADKLGEMGSVTPDQRDKDKRQDGAGVTGPVDGSRRTGVSPNVPEQFGTVNPVLDLSAEIARVMGVAPEPAPVHVAYVAPARQAPAARSSVEFPPGLLGEIADFIYRSSPRPVREIALAGAIGLMAGMCGRSYNYSGAGLNQYVMLLAATGRGKEAIPSGISRLMSALTEMDSTSGEMVMASCPAAAEFVGPSALPSGPGLLKVFSKQKSFVSVVGEIGLWMQRINHPRANAADLSVKTVLLDLYGKSSHGNTVGSSAYSNQDNNTTAIKSPALTFLGEGTPATFFASLDEMLIASGFLPRFLTIHYDGPRVELNTENGDIRPSVGLIDRLGDLAVNCITLNSADHVNHVRADDEALTLLDQIDREATAIINDVDRARVLDELYNRCHMKTFKLAALVAVGIDPDSPIITVEAVRWANDIVQRDIDLYVRKFELGDIGADTGESKQVRDVIGVVSQYLTQDFSKVAKYGVNLKMHGDHVITYSYLQRRLVGVASFRHDRVGATNAIKRTLQSMLDEGSLVEVGRQDLGKYNQRGKAYVIGDVNRFMDVTRS